MWIIPDIHGRISIHGFASNPEPIAVILVTPHGDEIPLPIDDKGYFHFNAITAEQYPSMHGRSFDSYLKVRSEKRELCKIQVSTSGAETMAEHLPSLFLVDIGLPPEAPPSIRLRKYNSNYRKALGPAEMERLKQIPPDFDQR